MRRPTRGDRGATLVCVLITGFAAGAAETNCYLLAPRPDAAAIVIDPGDDAVPTLEYYFAVNELTPAAVLLTSGRREVTGSAFDLCAGWDIPVYLHPADRDLLTDPPEILRDLADGDQVQLAGIDVQVAHTPGQTAGALVYRVLADTDEGPAPVVFTGHTLGFRTVGGPGCEGDRRQLLRSVREKLLVLDDDTVVLPAHGTSTTIGDERRHNKHLDDDQHLDA